MLGVAFGLGLGTVAGLSVGPQIFPRLLKPRDLSFLDESADNNDEVEVPEPGTKIAADMRRLLVYTEPWTTNPDFQRVSMINRIIKIMWPTLTKAILDVVLVQVKVQLEQQVFNNKALWFVEDIVVGTDGMHPQGVKDFSKWVKDRQFSVGSIPPRVGGFKLYDTSEDEVILEMPLLFGSNLNMDIGVFLRFGPLRLYVPVQVADLHFKGEARITLKPLVDTIPCIGGATVSLLSTPHVDCTLKMFRGVDLMALPIVKDVIRHGLKMVLESMMVQPNFMSFPVMPNFGLMPPAKGAVNVKLLRGERLKDLPLYVEVEIRKGRSQTTNTLVPTMGRAEWGHEFNLIVDDFEMQTLTLKVIKDDLGWNDTQLTYGELKFGQYDQTETVLEDGTKLEREFKVADFIKVPMNEQLVEVKLHKAKNVDSKGLLATGAGAVLGAPGQAITGVKTIGKGMGKGLQKVFSKADHHGHKHKKAMDAAGVGGLSQEQEAAIDGMEARKPEKDRGSLYLKVMFIPFFQPTYDDEEEEEPDEKPAAKTNKPPPSAQGAPKSGAIQPPKASAAGKKKPKVVLPSVRQVTTNVPDKLKGVLTITLVRCINLNGDDVTSYVRFQVSDEEHDQVQKSQTVFSQNSPRWGQKFDFVMITAGSSLYLTVYGKRGLSSDVINTVQNAVNVLNVFSKKKSEEEQDKVLGKLEIRVRDVVRNGTIKDIWTLQDTEKGQIEMVLNWQTCYILDD